MCYENFARSVFLGWEQPLNKSLLQNNSFMKKQLDRHLLVQSEDKNN